VFDAQILVELYGFRDQRRVELKNKQAAGKVCVCRMLANK
jgi:hypothetical protein